MILINVNCHAILIKFKTYYFPTHGDSGLVKPIQLTKKGNSKTFLKKDRNSKN